MKKFLIFILTLFVANCFSARAEAIKIGLQTNVSQTIIAASDGGVITDNDTGVAVAKAAKMKPYRLKASGDNITIKIGEKYQNLHIHSIVLTPVSGFVSVKSKWYRGKVIVTSKGGKLTVINDLDLELYLLGVVPSEMPSRWNIEAHTAQAIAARSYALANLGKRGSRGYDLNDTPADQAYGGASAEKQSTNIAVIETKGQVLTYNNKIIPAYYCASAGGKTLNSGAVWNVDLPYLHSVASFDEKVKKNGHGVGMSQHGANNLANMGYNAYQILGYFYDKVHLQVIK